MRTISSPTHSSRERRLVSLHIQCLSLSHIPFPFTNRTADLNLRAGDAIAGAGFFLDTPVLTTTLSTVSHVDSNCNNATSSTAQKAIFDTLTKIDASAEISLGVIAQAEVKFAGDGNLQDVDKYAVFTKTFDLPTGCVSFDAAAKTYGAASTATGTAAAGAKPSKSVGSVAVLGRENAGLERVMTVLGALVAVFVVF